MLLFKENSFICQMQAWQDIHFLNVSFDSDINDNYLFTHSLFIDDIFCLVC